MSGAFVIAGFLLGFMSAHISVSEPGWALLLIPGVGAFITGLIIEDSIRK